MKRILFLILLCNGIQDVYAQYSLDMDTTIHGKVKTIRHEIRDKEDSSIVINTHIAHYDENGRLISLMTYMDGEEFIYLKKEYDGDHLSRLIRFNGPNDTASVTNYVYGEFGLIAEDMLEYFGKVVKKGYRYYYSPEGLLLRETTYRYYGDEVYEQDHKSYTYDEKGELIGMIEHHNGAEWTFGKNSYVVINPSMMTKTEGKMDDFGREISSSVYTGPMSEFNDSDEEQDQKAIEYSLHSDSRSSYDLFGHLLEKVSSTNGMKFREFYVYKYDEQGNIVSYQFYDTNYGTKRLNAYFTREIEYYP